MNAREVTSVTSPAEALRVADHGVDFRLLDRL
jgi:hypothetical protein